MVNGRVYRDDYYGFFLTKKKKRKKEEREKKETPTSGSDRAVLRGAERFCSSVCTDETIQRFVMEQSWREVRSSGMRLKVLCN